MDRSIKIIFSCNKYTKNVLKDYSTKKKIHKSENELVDILINTVAYAFMDKSTRISTIDGRVGGQYFLNAGFHLELKR